MKRENFFGYEKYSFGGGALSVSVVTLGATVTELRFAGRNMVLCYPDAAGYLDGTAYICAAIGRYANRIAGARFTLNGREYVLPANEGKNQLHGGPGSYDKRRWEAEVLGDDSVRFTLHSPDGDNGFPGNLTASVTYTVSGMPCASTSAASATPIRCTRQPRTCTSTLTAAARSTIPCG